jgi:hypothetical protein
MVQYGSGFGFFGVGVPLLARCLICLALQHFNLPCVTVLRPYGGLRQTCSAATSYAAASEPCLPYALVSGFSFGAENFRRFLALA